jgi:SRSO17 transposase
LLELPMVQSRAVAGSEAVWSEWRQWQTDLEHWLAPFVATLPRVTQRKWAPLYLEGLLGGTERKSVQPIARAVAADDYDQLHHFLTTTAWDAAPLKAVLVQEAVRLVGAADAVLIIDDTTLLKKGTHSVGVGQQYSGQVGKLTNCQTLVSLTLARGEVPVPIALRLFLPEAWASDPKRCRAAGIPAAHRVHIEKWQLALDELDRVMAAGLSFGTGFGIVLADAAYGSCAPFRNGLSARGLVWALGARANVYVYPADVRVTYRRKGGGRRRHPRPLTAPQPIARVARTLRWRAVTWRAGTKGPLRAQFAARRVRPSEGRALMNGWKQPGPEVWLVGERRQDGHEQFYLTNLPATATLRELAQAIKARWSCEQAHQQLKEELGLDHFEGRSWTGLEHHTVLTMMAYAFLQHHRLRRLPRRRGKKIGAGRPGPSHAARGTPCAPRRPPSSGGLRPDATVAPPLSDVSHRNLVHAT